MDIKELESLQQNVDKISWQLYGNDICEAQNELGTIVQKVNAVYLSYINSAPVYAERGIDIPKEILLSQMKNLLEAIEERDILMLADTLQYEIREGLLFFIDVEKEME